MSHGSFRAGRKHPMRLLDPVVGRPLSSATHGHTNKATGVISEIKGNPPLHSFGVLWLARWQHASFPRGRIHERMDMMIHAGKDILQAILLLGDPRAPFAGPLLQIRRLG